MPRLLALTLVVASCTTPGSGDAPTPDAGTPVVASNGQNQEDCDGMLEAYNLKRVGSYDGPGQPFQAWQDEGVSASHRNDTWIAIASEPPVADVEYLSVFMSGQQTGAEFGVGGFRATVTGQFENWRNAIDTGGPDDDINTCKWGMLGRTKYDEGYQFPAENFVTKRTPMARTFAAAAFEPHLQYGASNDEIESIRDAFYAWLKSKGDPARVKGIYLTGASRGGCLALMLASKFQNDASSDGLWKKVPIIVQGFDAVCNPERAAEMGATTSTRDNPLHPGDDPGLDINPGDFFAYKSQTFADYFPQPAKVAISLVFGGGKITSVSNARAITWLDNDGDVDVDGFVWFRQRWVDMEHPEIGRLWHHTIVGEAMTWWRTNYNAFDMWGTQVYFPHTDTQVNETGAAPTISVPVSAHLGKHDRQLVVRIEIEPTSTATYGVDYVIPGVASLPADIDVTIPAHAFGASLPIQILHSSGVEPDETIDLKIGAFPVLGKPGLYGGLKTHRVTIVDKDTTPFTEATCVAAGGVWNAAIGMCALKAEPYGPVTCAGDGGTFGDGACALTAVPVRVDNCPDEGRLFSWNPVNDTCELTARPQQRADEVTCIARGGRWDVPTARCRKLPTAYDAKYCRADSAAFGNPRWNEQTGTCTLPGLTFRQGTCEHVGGFWDDEGGVCQRTVFSPR